MTNTMKKLQKKRKGGFTLIELIVVIAILAILMALALPAFNNLKTESAQKVADANARTVFSAGVAAQALVDEAGDIDAKMLSILGTFDGTPTLHKDAAGNVDGAKWVGTVNGSTYTGTYGTTD